MAAINQSHDTPEKVSVWQTTFSDQMRHDLREEDHIAFRNICIILISIVTGGLILGLLGVLSGIAVG